MSNAWWEPLTFIVPEQAEFVVALASGARTPELIDDHIVVPPRSTVVLRRAKS
jgi:hypothetical protein